MKNKYSILLSLILMLSLVLLGCTVPANSGEQDNSDIEELNAQVKELNTQVNNLTEENAELIVQIEELELELNNGNNNPAQTPTSAQSLWDIGHEVMSLIKDKDMVALSAYVHPTKGLRFTPYVHINSTFDQVFTPQQVAGLPGDTTEYDWGYYYGTPVETKIMLNFNDYYDEFIYDEDFLNANIIGVNAVVSYGVMIDNVFDEYPDAEYLEFYIITSQDNNNIYWRSLKVAFEKVGGEYKLMGIIHGQWTDEYGVE